MFSKDVQSSSHNGSLCERFVFKRYDVIDLKMGNAALDMIPDGSVEVKIGVMM